MKKLSLALTFLLFVLLSFGQAIESLPTEKSAYLKALSKQFEDTKRSELKELLKELEKQIQSGQFTDEMLNNMIVSTNKMLAMRGKAYPQLSEMTENYVKLSKLGLTSDKVRDIHETLIKVMDNSKKGDTKATITFMEFLVPLHEKKSLYFTTSKSWFFTSDSYMLKYEDGPVIIIPKTDIIGTTAGDSIMVFNTGGKYEYSKFLWKGDKGDVDWTKAGLPKTEVFASFGKYEIDVTKSSYEVTDVQFTYKNYFSKSIKGKLEDKLLTGVTKDNVRFPRFSADSESVPPQEISSNVVYYGGFTLAGSKIAGDADGEKAMVVVYKPNTKIVVLRAFSSNVVINKPEKLNASNATVSLYFDNDSIYHPSVTLAYNLQTNEIKILRADGSLGQSKFLDSYHQMDFDADVVTWNLNNNYIDISTISTSGIKEGIYESKEFFSSDKMRQIRGNVSYDPLSLLKKHKELYEFSEITAIDYAKMISPTMTVQQIKPLIYNLVQEGFITYDEKRELITIGDKIDHYVRSNAKQKDYDNIRIESRTKQANSRIDLTTKEMKMEGVESVPISYANSTIFTPSNKTIIIKKNRDMLFDSLFFCGRLDFFGENHSFLYDSFNMVLPKIDTLIMNIPDGDKLDAYGKPLLRPINSVLENLKGDVNINIPINKSGRADLPQFPIFRSLEKSKVFYDAPNIKAGSYDRERFYYELTPFTLPSLNNLNISNLVFDGTLYSADIFPLIKEPIRVQPDLFLGFEITSPPDGYEIYKKKGRFVSEISLNGKGLNGRGTIKYQTAAFDSKDIQFYPDSLFATSDVFSLEQKKGAYESPSAKNKINSVAWFPYQDIMNIVAAKQDPFVMFNDRIKLDGSLTVTNKGISGAGVADWDDAQLISNQFKFKSQELQADTAELKMKSIEGDKVTFNTPNVNAFVDFSKNTGFFKSNLDNNKTDFNYNQYYTTIDEFFWDIDAKKLQFSVPKGAEGASFTSTHPNQDSLTFKAANADYSLVTSIIEAKNVSEILVADSRVIPKNGEVTIKPEAVMEVLKDATIEASVGSKKHLVENVTANIMGKNKMSASGKYKFTAKNTTAQYIEMPKIEVILADSSMLDKKKKQKIDYIIKGEGTISQNENFMLYPNVNYYGKAEFFSTLDNLKINGYTKIDFKSPHATSNFFEVNTLVNTENFEMNISGAKDPNGREVRTGIFVSKTGMEPLYTNILNNQIAPIDIPLIEVKGIIKHNFEKNEYVFGEGIKINKEEEFSKGNILKFSPDKNYVYAEGTLDLGLEYGVIKETAFGSIENDLSKNKYTLHTTLAIPLELDKVLLERLGYYFFEDNYDADEVDYSNEKNLLHWVEMTNPKTFKKIKEDVAAKGVFEKPKEITSQFIFTDVNLEYNPTERTYRSVGKFGLAFIGEKAIHKKINGWLEFGHRLGSDYMNIYITTSFGDYLYMSFSGVNLEVVSSIDDLNKILNSIDPSKRKIKGEGVKYYNYFLGSDFKAKNFVKRMKGEYVEEEIEKPRQIIDFGQPKEDENQQQEKPKKEEPQRINIDE